MEAIGRLAGGIAHDFNNILTAILGYTELLITRKDINEIVFEYLCEIKNAAKRAENLIQQILAFSRKQIFKPKVININNIVDSIEKMLRRIIGERIEFKTVLNPNIGNIEVDPNQIEQIIINLVVNARDAMPDGGILKIQTDKIYFDQEYCKQHIGAKPGNYIMISISDTGIGMDKNTKKHIFEPFFTTKGRGKGTGLGLSTVYGIVKQNKGYIYVYSEKGRGTDFRIYFPEIVREDNKQIVRENKEEHINRIGNETILIVDDDKTVRKVITRILSQYGYDVVEIEDIINFEQIIDKLKKEKIDLLLIDVVIPGVKSIDLVHTIKKKYPDIKVIYISGYSEDVIERYGILKKDICFLQKPISAVGLISKVQEVLKSNEYNY